MQVIMKRPGEVAEVGELASYEAMREFIGGHFETVPFCTSDGSPYLIVCNDNFLNDGSKFNKSFCGVQFFGNIFICKDGVVNDIGERDFVGLYPSDIAQITFLLDWSEADRLSLLRSCDELSASLI